MRILAANFFPAFHPPGSGGEQRYYYLYHYLSRSFDVTLISPTYSNHAFEVVQFSTTFREHRVPKDQIFDRLHWKLGVDEIGPECSAYVVALAAAADTDFGRRFEALAGDADVIVHESPFTFPYDHAARSDGKPRIYNAYNVEHRLAAQILKGPRAEKAVEFIRFIEQSLVSTASLVLATSEDEKALFVSDFGADPDCVVLVRNGFEPAGDDAAASPKVERNDGAPYTIFMGSAHPPNVEAALYIRDELARAMPDVEFRLVGSVCGKLQGPLPANVKSLGFVDESEKRRLLAGCRAALNPLLSGAGTNLKMLDYMAAAAPIVSTPVGARGLGLRHGVDAFVANDDQYVETLRLVLRDTVLASRVGAQARQRAFAEFTWERIAEQARIAIKSSTEKRFAFRPDASSSRPPLLVVNDFPVSVTAAGGHVRIRELLAELGREFDVVLLCLTSETRRDERILAPGVLEICIPKTAAHRQAEVDAGRGAVISVDDIIASQFCTSNIEFATAFRGYVSRCRAVVFEHPYLAPMLDFVPSDKPVVYSSLNVESELKVGTLALRPDSAAWTRQVDALEERLLERANLVICVSVEDRARFSRRHPRRRYEVIENGVRTAVHDAAAAHATAPLQTMAGRALALFIGSSHMPNVEAVKFLCSSVARRAPEVTFGIVGAVCDAVRLIPRPPNVMLFGPLPEAEKNLLLASATFAVNPMLQGGGSSLKIPDFFAARLPVVSTRIGARGYDLVDGKHYVAADGAEFASATRKLSQDSALRRRLARNARQVAEDALDWRVLGARYRRALRSLVAPDAKPRALVVTYRFADPPPGGAETFLVNVLRELAKRGNLAIDVATCDVGAIANKWHFSGDYALPIRANAGPSFGGRIHRFPVDAPGEGDFERCRRLFAVWMAESRKQPALLNIDLPEHLLLGGWNFPETVGGRTSRWASGEAQVRVGAKATALHIGGYAPIKLLIEVWQGGAQVASRAAKERFAFSFDLPGGDPMVVLKAAQLFRTEEDPRELAFVVDEMSVDQAGVTHQVDLAQDFGMIARKLSPEKWVASLIALTNQRDASDDELFVQVRGPHSSELRQWLEDNVASYDVVLAQGVPFSTPVLATDLAARHGVPVVLLPHFHMEDRYYHWRTYYEMFRRAQCVIAAPTQAQPMFFDAIGANSSVVPGGGVDLSEYEASRRSAHQAAFRTLHGGSKPFVLVLGRKAGAKNYQLAIDATLALNRDGHRIDLVLIGPDDDGIPITAPHTYYYGAQPRDVVLGALSLALCLTNMSESESFGIVLLEAWLSGTPVIAQRDCMAFAELVLSRENGVLVERSSELAQAIEDYLGDPELAKRHAEIGRKVAKEYAWSEIAAAIEGILLRAVKPVGSASDLAA